MIFPALLAIIYERLFVIVYTPILVVILCRSVWKAVRYYRKNQS